MKKEKQTRELLRKFETTIAEHAKRFGYIGGLGVKTPYEGYELEVFGGDSFGQKATDMPKNKMAFYFRITKWGVFGYEKTVWMSKAFYLTKPAKTFQENIKNAVRESYPDMMEFFDTL